VAEELLRAIMPSERCTAQKHSGGDCTRWGVRGSKPALCIAHGGRLPSQRAKAALRVEEAKAALASLAPKIVRTWSEMLDSADESIRLKAAADAGKFVFASNIAVEMRAEIEVGSREEASRVKVRKMLDDIGQRMLDDRAARLEAEADAIMPGMVIDADSEPLSVTESGSESDGVPW
jgi:hypothetical protein